MPHIKKLRESTIAAAEGPLEAYGEALRVWTPSAFDSDIMYMHCISYI